MRLAVFIFFLLSLFLLARCQSDETSTQPITESIAQSISQPITQPSTQPSTQLSGSSRLSANTHAKNRNIVQFSKKMYSYLGVVKPWNATFIADHFRPEFDRINADGTVGSALMALYDMRMQDLQTSVKHTRRMQEVLSALDQ
jgi:hypothetical protein